MCINQSRILWRIFVVHTNRVKCQYVIIISSGAYLKDYEFTSVNCIKFYFWWFLFWKIFCFEVIFVLKSLQHSWYKIYYPLKHCHRKFTIVKACLHWEDAKQSERFLSVSYALSFHRKSTTCKGMATLSEIENEPKLKYSHWFRFSPCELCLIVVLFCYLFAEV